MISRAQATALYVALYRDDVQANPTHYRPSVVAAPGAHALAIIDGLSREEISRMLKELRAEILSIRRTKQ